MGGWMLASAFKLVVALLTPKRTPQQKNSPQYPHYFKRTSPKKDLWSWQKLKSLRDGGVIQIKWANGCDNKAIHTCVTNVKNPKDVYSFPGPMEDLQRLSQRRVAKRKENHYPADGSFADYFQIPKQPQTPLHIREIAVEVQGVIEAAGNKAQSAAAEAPIFSSIPKLLDSPKELYRGSVAS
ncbi:uncharacterized protein TrAtP1_002284 [Trichoderma atroviride]|uniref:uncharacterized protein n=1 Tax=Hypocrea atroviridis TaxID=63577 RepID=UPI003325D0BD|nr:hypothetical protein TrAtP1_002284 [Trichoderma atroviride]